MERFKKYNLKEADHMVFDYDITKACFSHQGNRRSQQDTCLATERLCIVADGNDSYKSLDASEGYRTGKDASNAIIEAVESEFHRFNHSAYSHEEGGEVFLRRLVRRTKENINKINDEVRDGERVGTTFVGTFLDNLGFLNYTNIGDSNLLLFRGGRLYQLTEEDNLAWFVLKEEEGVIETCEDYDFEHYVVTDEERYHNSELQNQILNRISSSDNKPIDHEVRKIKILEGDTLLLCSDGLRGQLTTKKMESLLINYIKPGESVNQDILNECNQALINEAYSSAKDSDKGSDNIVAVLSRVNSMEEYCLVDEGIIEIADVDTDKEGILLYEEDLEETIHDDSSLNRQSEIDQLKVELAQVNGTLSKRILEKEQLKLDYNTLKDEYDELDQNNENLKLKVGKYELERGTIRNLEIQIQNLKDDKDVFTKRNKGLVDRLGEQGRQLQDLRANASAKLESTIKEAEDKFKAAEVKYSERIQDIESEHEKIIEELEQKLRNYDESDLEKIFFGESLNEEIEELERRNETLAKTVIELTDELGKYKTLEGELNDVIKTGHGEIKNLDKQVEKQEKENKYLKTTNDRLNKRLKSYRRDSTMKRSNGISKGIWGLSGALISLVGIYLHDKIDTTEDLNFDIPELIEDFNPSRIIEDSKKPKVSRYMAESEDMIGRLRLGDKHPEYPDSAVSCEEYEQWKEQAKKDYEIAQGDQERKVKQEERVDITFEQECGNEQIL